MVGMFFLLLVFRKTNMVSRKCFCICFCEVSVDVFFCFCEVLWGFKVGEQLIMFFDVC